MRVSPSLPIATLIVALLVPEIGQATESSEIVHLLDQAEALTRVVPVEKGAARPVLEEAEALLDVARQQLDEAEIEASERRWLSAQLAAIRDNLDALDELYGERFFGVFPLARLTLPTLLADEGLDTTEQLFHRPDEAAAAIATERLLRDFGRFRDPNVVVSTLR